MGQMERNAMKGKTEYIDTSKGQIRIRHIYVGARYKKPKVGPFHSKHKQFEPYNYWSITLKIPALNTQWIDSALTKVVAMRRARRYANDIR